MPVKYMAPGDVKLPEGDTEKRRQRAPRGPTLRSLVKLAMRCDSAEQMGKQLKRRFDRSLQRQGAGRHPSDDRENAREFDRLLTR
jgi:hypothetical protein